MTIEERPNDQLTNAERKYGKEFSKKIEGDTQWVLII